MLTANNIYKISFAVLVLCFFTSFQTFASDNSIVVEYIENEYDDVFDDLMQKYGKNKTLPEGYELPALLALSHFPKLVDVRIDFVFRNRGAPLASRPKFGSMFLPKDKWIYEVIIGRKTIDMLAHLALENLPFNARIGVFGHELAHTEDYIDKGFFQMLSTGFCMIFKNCADRYEWSTEQSTIDHGLGWQLYSQSVWIADGFKKQGYEGSSERYMGPEAVLAYMVKTGMYEVRLTNN